MPERTSSGARPRPISKPTQRLRLWRLTQVVTSRILARGETPFLHVFAHNVGAIRIYEALGFTVRTTMKMTVLRRA